MRTLFHANSILLTGATGFVGKRLLRQLLKQTRASIICLIRADNDDQAQHRGREISNDPRVSFIQADLEKHRLGLSELVWQSLALAVREIYHCAASVKFDLSLNEAQRINVDGTRRLLQLATIGITEGAFLRFHHVSTAYVSGRITGPVHARYLPSDQPWRYRNTYERTKARAERLLRSQTQVPVTIYRPSIVAGDSSTGATDAWNVLYTPMRMIHRGQLPILRMGGNGRLDCVGVDFVVKGILALSRCNTDRFDSFHLTAGACHFDVADLARTSVIQSRFANLNSQACCRVVSPVKWLLLRLAAQITALAPLRLKKLRHWGRLAARGFRQFRAYEPYTGVETIFDCERETRLLERENVRMPRPLEYLNRIAAYAIASDFGAAKPTKAEEKQAS